MIRAERKLFRSVDFRKLVNDCSSRIEKKIVTGAYGIGKTMYSVPRKDSFPKPNECGEDSFLVAENLKKVAFGVADGVGVNTKKFSTALMRHSTELIKSNAKIFNTADLIKLAFFRLVEESITTTKDVEGASTVCAVPFDKETGQVEYGNLGDSGFMLLSPNENGNYLIKQKSKILQNTFNFPYQCALEYDGSFKDDGHKIELVGSITTKPNDVILVMTDGVMDNVYQSEIENLVTDTIKLSKNPQVVAAEIAYLALKF